MHADNLCNTCTRTSKLRHKRKTACVDRRHVKASNRTIQFDSIKTSVVGSSIVPVPVPYDDLRFSGFGARTDGVNIIRAHSPPNVVGNGPLRDVLSGGAPPSNITIKYPGSRLKYYKAIKTFLGCAVISTVPGTGLPPIQAAQPCQILFSGVNSKKAPISQTCSFSATAKKPDGSVALEECKFDQTRFGDVVTLNVTVATSLTVPTTTVALIDNFNHTNYY